MARRVARLTFPAGATLWAGSDAPSSVQAVEEVNMFRIVRASMRALFMVVSLGAATALVSGEERHDGEPAVLTRPARDLLWEAALVALGERGLIADVMAREEGQITSMFAPLDVDEVGRFTVPDQDTGRDSWNGAEYRYVVNLGDLPDRARISVRAEIRGSMRADPSAEPTTRSALRSNRVLEKEFMKAFGSALGRLGTD